MIARLLRYVPQPVVWRFAKRYIAGTSIQEAIETVRRLNDQGALATISYLGEHITDPRQCHEALEQYLILLVAIERYRLRANVSVKPTQLGMNLDQGSHLWRSEFLVQQAAKSNIFVRFDMEDSSCTDATLELYCRLRQKYRRVGTVIQASLRRSGDDVRRLAKSNSNIRLCKGIYRESGMIAYRDRQEIRRSYIRLLARLLQGSCFVGIATHDQILVEWAERMIETYNVPPSRYQFELLLGVRPKLRRQLMERGHPVLVYVPYGQHWYEYSLRRLQENPAFALNTLKGLLSGR